MKSGNAIHIGGCRAHLIEQRGGGGCHSVDRSMALGHRSAFVAAGREEYPTIRMITSKGDRAHIVCYRGNAAAIFPDMRGKTSSTGEDFP
jgi:hypothetical protein